MHARIIADALKFLAFGQLASVAAKFVSLLDPAEHAEHAWALVSSDSLVALDEFSRLANLTDADLLVPRATQALHIDNSAQGNQTTKAFARVLLEFLLLAKCDAAVVTERSGFGRLGLLLAGPPVKARMRGRYVLAMRDSTVRHQRYPESTGSTAGGNNRTIPAIMDFCDYDNDAYGGVYLSRCL